MSDLRILLFAGTTEGRLMAEALGRLQIPVSVSVATEYGETLLPIGEHITHLTGRMDETQMAACMQEGSFSHVIDATHPYAVIVSQNIKKAAATAGTEYIRLLRAEDDNLSDLSEKPISMLSGSAAAGECYFAASVEEACNALRAVPGNILASTGSKELHRYTVIDDYEKRVFARVLSTNESVQIAKNLHFEGRNLICMQGPFSEEMNYATMLQYDIRFLVTKNSGKAGGYADKIRAAKHAGAVTIIIGRPQETDGKTFAEVYSMMESLSGHEREEKRHVSLVSIGTGSFAYMTDAAKEAFKNADALVGAGRMLEAVKEYDKPMLVTYKNQEMVDWLLDHPEYKTAAIAFSGDTGFYSGAKKLLPLLQENGFETEVIPGISSLVYLSAKLGKAWDDAKLMSIHGRSENLISAVKNEKKVFTLLGGKNAVKELCEELIRYGLSHVHIWIGENLSYADEAFADGSPEELLCKEFGTLCVALIENESGGNQVVTHGIMDEEFIRDKVPMTKLEVRAVSLSVMKIHSDSIIYDVGAGTGSVSIEAALQAADGMVYAIEKKPEAAALIRENSRKFGTSNLVVIEGLAPDAMEGLPAPDIVFIGGSSGNMKQVILECLSRNPEARFVVNAIALETIAEVTQLLKELPVEDIYISEIFAARAKKLGSYEMMMGQNPVMIAAFKGKKEA